MFATFSEPIVAGVGNGVSAGVFIPLADLPGMDLAELATTGATLDGHETYSLLNSLYSALVNLPTLGIVNITKSAPTGTGANLFTEGIGFTFQFLLNLESGTLGPIPLATIGSEAGYGAVYLSDVWPLCEKIAAEGEITEPGLLIPDSWVNGYGGGSVATVDDDARQWIGGLLRGLLNNITARTSTTASAIVTRTSPTAIRMTGVSIPAAWVDATNPLTGIPAADLAKVRVVQESYLIEYAMAIDPDTQTLEINVATS